MCAGIVFCSAASLTMMLPPVATLPRDSEIVKLGSGPEEPVPTASQIATAAMTATTAVMAA
jgi:hypothetical protein